MWWIGQTSQNCILVLTKKSTTPGHRMLEEILRMPKVIADIAQRGGKVIITPVSWAPNINAWDVKCPFAISAQYLNLSGMVANHQYRISMCNLHLCYTFCTGVTLFALVLRLNCTALSQSESSNFSCILLQMKLGKNSRYRPRSVDGAEFGHSTLLFCRGRHWNVQRFITHVHSYCFAL